MKSPSVPMTPSCSRPGRRLRGAAALGLALLLGAGAWPTLAQQPRSAGSGSGSGDSAMALERSDWRELARAFGGHLWVTRPSADVRMRIALPNPSPITEIAVRAGQEVKAGDLLVRARDAEILQAIAQQEKRVENRTEIQAAEAGLDLAQFRFDRAVEARNSGNAVSPTEFKQLEIDLLTARINLEAAQRRWDDQVMQVDQLRVQLERYTLLAPFDGVVEDVLVETGEAVSENEDVIRVVAIDPMWVDVPVPATQVIERGLREGMPAWILLNVPGRTEVTLGRIHSISPTADYSASGIQRVRVEAANPRRVQTGIEACVRFDEPASGWDGSLARSDGGQAR